MDVVAAFELLQLPLTATELEIRNQYRELAQTNHPDAGGDEAHMKKLNVAYEAAIRHSRSSAMVPLTAVLDLVNATSTQAEMREDRRARSHQAVQHLIRRHTSPLKSYKRRGVFLSSVSGGLAVLTSKALGFLDKTPLFNTPEMRALFQSPKVTTWCAVTAAVTGVYAWAFSTMAADLEHDIEDLNDTLSDKGECLDILLAITSDSPGPWTTRRMQMMVADWCRARFHRDHRSRRLTDMEALVRILYAPFFAFLPMNTLAPMGRTIQGLARRLGVVDFTRLLIVKLIERGILIENDARDADSPAVTYSMAYPQRKDRPNGGTGT